VIRLYKPTLKRKDMDAVLTSMADEQIAPGDRNKEFALLLKRYLKSENAVTLRSIKDALELSLRAVGIISGKKIAVSVLSPKYYIHVLKRLDAEAVFIDIDPKTALMSCEAAAEIAENREIDAVLLHEPFGMVPDSAAADVFRNIPVPVIEDITDTLGVCENESDSERIGCILVGGLEEKSIITAGGGAYTAVRDKKFLKSVEEQMHVWFSDEDYLPDMNAALGIQQIKHIDEFLTARREMFIMMQKAVMKTRHHAVMPYTEPCTGNGYAFPVMIESGMKAVSKFMKKYGIEADLSFSDTILDDLDDLDEKPNYPAAASVLQRTISFPIYPLLSREQLKTIIRVLSTLP